MDATIEEQQWIRQARSGDREAFGRIVEKNMRRAYYAALGLVGSHDDALDLSQEAFARAYRAISSFDPDRPFYAWFYSILRRLCFNFTRDRKLHRDRLSEARSWLVSEARARADAADPEQEAVREESRLRVRKAIETLPDRVREVLVLKEYEGLKYKEIANLLGIPTGTVMSRLYDARQRLAAALEDEQ